MKPTCARPTCTRVADAADYDGLCLHHARAAGIAHRLYTWEDTKREYDRLIGGGWTNQHLETAGVIFAVTARDIRDHRRDKFQHVTVQALKETPTLSPYRRATWPLSRRLKALRAIGFTYARMGQDMGRSRTFLQSIAEQVHEWTGVETDEQIRAYYDEHQYDPAGPVCRKTAMANYPRPADWDDIDDPHEEAVASIERVRLPPLRRRKVTPELLAKTRALVEHYGNVAATARALHSGYWTVRGVLDGPGKVIPNRLAEKIAYHYKNILLAEGV